MAHAGLSTNDGSTTSLANNNSVSSQEGDSDDRVALAQALLQRCLQKDTLLCELYVQLIKQVTHYTTLHYTACCSQEAMQMCQINQKAPRSLKKPPISI